MAPLRTATYFAISSHHCFEKKCLRSRSNTNLKKTMHPQTYAMAVLKSTVTPRAAVPPSCMQGYSHLWTDRVRVPSQSATLPMTSYLLRFVATSYLLCKAFGSGWCLVDPGSSVAPP